MADDKHTWFVRSWGFLLTGCMVLLIIVIAVPAIYQSIAESRKQLSKYNLRSLGSALQNFHDVHDHFPPGGVFNEDGLAIEDWSAVLDPWLWQSSWYYDQDTSVSWDDPVNLDKYMTVINPAFLNPSVSQKKSPDGLPLNHYAANQAIFYRNSSVREDDLPNRSSTMLLGESNGNYPPRGYPYNWRDPTIGLKTSPDGFGCEARRTTLLLMADYSVQELNPDVSNAVLKAFAGSLEIQPTVEQVAKPSEPYHIGDRKR